MNRYFFMLFLPALCTNDADASYTIALNSTVAVGSAVSFCTSVRSTFDFINAHGFQLIGMEGMNTFVLSPVPRLMLDAITTGTMGYVLYKNAFFDSQSTSSSFLKGAMAVSAVASCLFFLVGLVTEKTIFSRHPHDMIEMAVISRLFLDALTVVAELVYIFRH